MLGAAVQVAVTTLAVLAAPHQADDFGWEAPQDCPSRSAVESQIRRWLAPGHEAASSITARGEVERRANGFRLVLRVSGLGRDETRTLESPSCERLAAAAALIVAVAMDPVAAAERLQTRRASASIAAPSSFIPEPPTGAEAPAPPGSPEVPRPAPATASAAPRWGAPEETPTSQLRGPVRLGLRADLGVAGGLLPRAGPGLGAAFAVMGAAGWRAELVGAYWLMRIVEARAEEGVGAELWAAEGGARGCGVPAVRTVEFPVCAGIDVGAIGGRGRGDGITAEDAAALWWAGVGAAGLAWVPMRRLAVSLRGELVVPFRRPGFHLVGVGDVYRAAPAAGRGWFGVEIRFL